MPAVLLKSTSLPVTGRNATRKSLDWATSGRADQNGVGRQVEHGGDYSGKWRKIKGIKGCRDHLPAKRPAAYFAVDAASTNSKYL